MLDKDTKTIVKKKQKTFGGNNINTYICDVISFYTYRRNTQMGFISENGPRVQWARISRGKVVLSSKTELEGYESRETKVGTIIFERFFESFEGILTGISKKEGQFGDQFILAFTDGANVTNICVDYDSRYSRSLLNKLLNTAIDFKSTMKLSPFDFETREGQRRVGVNVWQGAMKVDAAYSKEQVPEPIKSVVKKQVTWDFTPQVEFFETRINQDVVPKLERSLPFIKQESKDETPYPVTRAVSIEKDIFDFE